MASTRYREVKRDPAPAQRGRFGLRPLWVMGLTAAVVACSDGPSPAEPVVVAVPPDLSLPLVTTTPAEAGFDPQMLLNAFTAADDVDRLQSLLVVRDGRLVAEEYFDGNRADSLNDVRSATKSVVSLLVGVAVRQGFISGVDQTLASILSPSTANLTAAQAGITVRDLLTMTGGWTWDESSAAGYNNWVLADDQIDFLLEQPQASAPGSAFNYNSAAVHLLGVAMEDASGMSLPDLADQFLFGPLGIARSNWESASSGRVNGGSGLDLLPRDMAKLGLLMLQGGQSGATRILPPSWATNAGAPAFPWRASFGPLQALSYGWLWWTEDPSAVTPRMYMAWGFGGQFIVVVPALRVVVVATTEWRGIGASLNEVEAGVLDVIVNGVLNAVVS